MAMQARTYRFVPVPPRRRDACATCWQLQFRARRRDCPCSPHCWPPASPELERAEHQLGAPTGVLAQAFDETQAVDNVLLRLRLEKLPGGRSMQCPGPTPASAVVDRAGRVQPKTQFDNAPWRFEMSQNGKRMTAEEFDAWMKARGVRVAKGAPGATTAPAPADAPEQDGTK